MRHTQSTAMTLGLALLFCASASAGEVTGLTLINAQDNSEIGPLENFYPLPSIDGM